jgi:nucleoside-diphosphate-sugar epimerase
MRVLVTGASGLIGGAAAAKLAEMGHETIGLSRHPSSSAPGTTGVIAADLGRPGAVDMIVDGQPRCDAIVHAAGTNDSSAAGPEISLTNCLGTQQMLELAGRWQVTSFVFISSLQVIGRPLRLPITEEHPVDPLTAYHASKLYGEQLVKVARNGGTPAASLRLNAPVGTGMQAGRIMSVFVGRALRGEPLEVAGEGTRCQDYVDVRDIASAVAAAVQRSATGLLNVASGRCISNLELARACVKVLGSTSEIRVGTRLDVEEGLRWEVSIDKARAALGYAPRYSLEESIVAVAEQLRPIIDA